MNFGRNEFNPYEYCKNKYGITFGQIKDIKATKSYKRFYNFKVIYMEKEEEKELNFKIVLTELPTEEPAWLHQ